MVYTSDSTNALCVQQNEPTIVRCLVSMQCIALIKMADGSNDFDVRLFLNNIRRSILVFKLILHNQNKVAVNYLLEIYNGNFQSSKV